jgi:hypothetical protein
MRQRLSIGTLVLAGLVAAPLIFSGVGASSTPGSVFVSLKSGRGLSVIGSRGSVLGRVRAGRIIATSNVIVRCWKSRTRLSSGLIRYRGRGSGCDYIRLRVSSEDSGAWRISIRGRGINVSGVVHGSLTLDGADSGSVGTYSIAGRSSKPWPRTRHTFALSS